MNKEEKQIPKHITTKEEFEKTKFIITQLNGEEAKTKSCKNQDELRNLNVENINIYPNSIPPNSKENNQKLFEDRKIQEMENEYI